MKVNKLLIAEFLEQSKGSKFKNISVSLVINFKIKSANMKFIQNFIHYLPHAVRPYNNKIIVYSSQKDLTIFDDKTYNGFEYDVSKVERSVYSAISDFDLSKNKAVASHFAPLNRRSIIPNNMPDYYSTDITTLVSDMRSGKAIKLYQMNNTMNVVVGTIDSTEDQITDNINSVVKGILHKGYLVIRGYMCLPMKKSIEIS